MVNLIVKLKFMKIVLILKKTQIPKLQNLTPAMLKGDYKITLVGDKINLKNEDKFKLSLD